MKIPARIVVWLLPILLAGCTHKNNSQVQPLAPPIEDTPPPKPAPPTNLPPPVVTIPNQTPAPDANADSQPKQPPKPPVKHKKSASKNTEQASAESPGVSAIGQLSTGSPNDLRQQTSASIAATERGLNAITRTLSDQEQKTASQIREFLKQAREALTSGDVDGAHTLAVKAKVLLSELAGT